MSDSNKDTTTDEPVWKFANKEAQEIVASGLYKIEEFVTAEPRMAAQRQLQLAQHNYNLRQGLRSEAWSKYHAHRKAWLDTYNAVIAGAYAQRLHDAAGNAACEADNLHGPLPEKPE